MLLLLVLVTAASALMSGDICNFPLTGQGLVDTCNLTTNVDAYQVRWKGRVASCHTWDILLGSTMEIQHWAQLSLARGPVKRCRQLGNCSTVKLFFASLSPPICGTFQLSGGFAMMDMSVFENLEEGQEKRGWLMTDIQVFCFPQYQYLWQICRRQPLCWGVVSNSNIQWLDLMLR